MVHSKRFADWLKRGLADLSAAHLLYDNNHDMSLVAFHCPQAVEKTLKGFILASNGDLVCGHSLLVLNKHAATIDKEFGQFRKDCAYLNQYYIETRYPADVPFEVAISDAKECLDIANSLVSLVNSKI